MGNPKPSSNPRLKILRWIARIYSAIIIFVLGFASVSELLGRLGLAPLPPQAAPLSTVDAIQFSSFFVILIGFAIAWKWELVGGLIVVIPIAIDVTLNPSSLKLLIFVAPAAILFLLCWWWSRLLRFGEKIVTETNSTTAPPTNA